MSHPSPIVPDDSPTSTTRSDSRHYERHTCHVETACKPAAVNEMRWLATLRDLSRSGVKLSLRRRFEPGAGLAIEVPEAPGLEAYTVFAKVVRAQAEAGGWALGCKFVSELSDDEVRRLLASGKPAEVASARLVIPEVLVEIVTAAGPVVCRVQRLHVPASWPLPPGKTLTIRGVALNGEQLHHRFEILACRPHGDGWALRVRFADPAAAPAWLRPAE